MHRSRVRSLRSRRARPRGAQGCGHESVHLDRTGGFAAAMSAGRRGALFKAGGVSRRSLKEHLDEPATLVNIRRLRELDFVRSEGGCSSWTAGHARNLAPTRIRKQPGARGRAPRRRSADPQRRDAGRQPGPAAALLVLPQGGLPLPPQAGANASRSTGRTRCTQSSTTISARSCTERTVPPSPRSERRCC